jgi:hypothetical protein
MIRITCSSAGLGRVSALVVRGRAVRDEGLGLERDPASAESPPADGPRAIRQRIRGRRSSSLSRGALGGAGVRDRAFGALKVDVENWRWAGVPFYLRSGSGSPYVTEIVIRSANRPCSVRKDPDPRPQPNRLVSRFPGDHDRDQGERPARPDLTQVDLDFATRFRSSDRRRYERLLYDAMTGDTTLFHAPTVEAAWRIATPSSTWGSTSARDFPRTTGRPPGVLPPRTTF